jgi:hypothetical protein
VPQHREVRRRHQHTRRDLRARSHHVNTSARRSTAPQPARDGQRSSARVSPTRPPGPPRHAPRPHWPSAPAAARAALSDLFATCTAGCSTVAVAHLSAGPPGSDPATSRHTPCRRPTTCPCFASHRTTHPKGCCVVRPDTGYTDKLSGQRRTVCPGHDARRSTRATRAIPSEPEIFVKTVFSRRTMRSMESTLE